MAEGIKQKVLIVDDVKDNIKILIDLLKPDYKTYFADNGVKALELAQNKSPDLILLDIVMPQMDGYEVCQKLKSNLRTNDIPVIFISAMSDVGDETKGLEIGAVDYITKPISP
ncbi:MAG: response regulator, partial [Proteobacteria bacterium]|nr:response regulator [Pseudomonadota bacterium]